jgi:hypothetical protein
VESNVFTLTLLEFLAPVSIALASPSDTQQVTPPHDQSRLQRLHTLRCGVLCPWCCAAKKNASIPKPSHGLHGQKFVAPSFCFCFTTVTDLATHKTQPHMREMNPKKHVAQKYPNN